MDPRSPRARYVNAAALLVFLAPVVGYWVYGLFIQPAPHYAAIDPEYEYFLNSLGVFKGQPYVYVDHPGTPVEMIGSAILAATYPWAAANPQGFVMFHLRRPEVFLNLAYGLLALAHLGCMLVFFRIALHSSPKSGANLGAALASMYFAIQPYAFSGSLLWSHNSFSFPFGTLLLLWLYTSLTSGRSRQGISIPRAVGLGVGTGVLAATTIFLAAWAVGILGTIILYYWLRSLPWRGMVLAAAGYGFGAIAGFYLAVLPVIGRIEAFWRWIYSILSHQSNYLAVPKNQPALERIAANTGDLLRLLPALSAAMIVVLALVLVAVVIWGRRIREQPGLWALAGGLTLQMLALTLVFVDRPLRAYYFLGVAAIVPVIAMAVLKLYENEPSTHRLLASAVSAAVLIGLVINSVQSIAVARAQAETVAASVKLTQQTIAQRAAVTGRAPKSLMVLWMYGTYSPCWALWFGDHRTGDAFDQEITRICPNQYELAGRVLLPNGRPPLQETKWDIVFTCDRYIDNVLANAPGAQVKQYPTIQWACGSATVILNK